MDRHDALLLAWTNKKGSSFPPRGGTRFPARETRRKVPTLFTRWKARATTFATGIASAPFRVLVSVTHLHESVSSLRCPRHVVWVFRLVVGGNSCRAHRVCQRRSAAARTWFGWTDVAGVWSSRRRSGCPRARCTRGGPEA